MYVILQGRMLVSIPGGGGGGVSHRSSWGLVPAHDIFNLTKNYF